MRLKVLRVNLDHVAAWWVIQLDEQGSASFSLSATTSCRRSAV
jgi:hypothetical protein